MRFTSHRVVSGKLLQLLHVVQLRGGEDRRVTLVSQVADGSWPVLRLRNLDDAAVVPSALRRIWQDLVVEPPVVEERNLHADEVQ